MKRLIFLFLLVASASSEGALDEPQILEKAVQYVCLQTYWSEDNYPDSERVEYSLSVDGGRFNFLESQGFVEGIGGVVYSVKGVVEPNFQVRSYKAFSGKAIAKNEEIKKIYLADKVLSVNGVVGSRDVACSRVVDDFFNRNELSEKMEVGALRAIFEYIKSVDKEVLEVRERVKILYFNQTYPNFYVLFGSAGRLFSLTYDFSSGEDFDYSNYFVDEISDGEVDKRVGVSELKKKVELVRGVWLSVFLSSSGAVIRK